MAGGAPAFTQPPGDPAGALQLPEGSRGLALFLSQFPRGCAHVWWPAAHRTGRDQPPSPQNPGAAQVRSAWRSHMSQKRSGALTPKRLHCVCVHAQTAHCPRNAEGVRARMPRQHTPCGKRRQASRKGAQRVCRCTS